jgi:hypothetical protein
MDIMTNNKGDKMSNPKYPSITARVHHRGTNPAVVIHAVLYALREGGVSASERVEYIDAVLAIIRDSQTSGQRSVDVVKESLKWVALTD